MTLSQSAPMATANPQVSGKLRFVFLAPPVTNSFPYVLDPQGRAILENAFNGQMVAYWTEKYSMVRLVQGWLLTPNSGPIKHNLFAQCQEGSDLVNLAQGPALTGGGTARLEIANWSAYHLAQGTWSGPVHVGPDQPGTTDASAVPLPGIRLSSPKGLKRLQLFLPTRVPDAGPGIAAPTALGTFSWPVVLNMSNQVLDLMQHWSTTICGLQGQALAQALVQSTQEIITSEAVITAPVEVPDGEVGSVAAAGRLEGVDMSAGLTGLVNLGTCTLAQVATSTGRNQRHATTLDLEVVNELATDIGWSVVNSHSDGNLVLQFSPTLPAAGIVTTMAQDGDHGSTSVPVANAADFKFSNGIKGDGPLQIVMTLGLGDGPGTPVAISISSAFNAPATLMMDVAGTPTTMRSGFSQVVSITVDGQPQNVTVDVQVSQSGTDLATDPMNLDDPTLSKGMCYCYGLIRIRPTP